MHSYAYDYRTRRIGTSELQAPSSTPQAAKHTAIVFSGGIGENSRLIRQEVFANFAWAGIVLDERLNEQVKGEMKISAPGSKTEIWVVPTNEEIIVARQSAELIAAG